MVDGQNGQTQDSVPRRVVNLESGSVRDGVRIPLHQEEDENVRGTPCRKYLVTLTPVHVSKYNLLTSVADVTLVAS